jgi:hypothetical protein
MISNFRTVIRHNDGTVQHIKHCPPLSTRTILEFLQMLMTQPRVLTAGAPGEGDCLPEADNTSPRPGVPAAPVPEQEIVGFFQDATGCHPLRVASPATILQIVTDRAPAYLGRFAVSLYLEAARRVGFGTTTNPVQDEAALRCLFAKVIRELLPEFRLLFQQPEMDATNDTPYSRRLLGSCGTKAAGVPRRKEAEGPTTAVAGVSAGSAPPSLEQPGNHREPDSYNQVMAQTVRGVLGLAWLELMQQPVPNPASLNFSSIACLASQIRRVVTGNNRGSDILPRTARRILGRAQRINLPVLDTIGMSDEELFGRFRHLTEIDAQALNG